MILPILAQYIRSIIIVFKIEQRAPEKFKERQKKQPEILPMTHRLSSPPLIKGINGIVSISPNEIIHSKLIEKITESRNQPGKEKKAKNTKNTKDPEIWQKM